MILLVNPNSNAATTRAMCALLAPVLPGLQGWTAPGGPSVIQTPDQLDAAGRRVAALDPPPGCHGVIVAAFGDPGAQDLAARLSVPVVGIGASAALEAGAGNRIFAVVTTTPALEDRVGALMRATGAGPYLGCFLTSGGLQDLLADPPALDAALLAAVTRAAQAGAQAVIIGGGPLAEAAHRLAPLSPVPLIQPLQAAARLLQKRLHPS